MTIVWSARHAITAPFCILATLLVSVSTVGCSSDPNNDNYTFSEAVVRGSVTQSNNSPVTGATVRIFAERGDCTASAQTSGELVTATTDVNGRYTARSTIGPAGPSNACLTVRVLPPRGISLADTVVSGVVVAMRAIVAGAVLDTATVNVRMRPAP